MPATAEKTGGYCMPCVQRKQREEREAYIKANRVDVNPYEGVTDPVEILKIIHQPRKRDPLKRYLGYSTPTDIVYAELLPYQAAAMRDYALALTENDAEDKVAETVVQCLAAFTEADLDPILSAYLRAKKYYPSMVFQRGGPSIRAGLLAEVQNGEANHGHLLAALAWIDGEPVVEQFSRWRKSPPAWRSELYVAPELYAHVAGWELSRECRRRDLYSKQCYPLILASAKRQHLPVATVVRSDNCPWCGRQLMNLFDLDLSDHRLRSLHQPDDRLPVLTCDVCTCYSPVFGEFNESGESFWSPHNTVPKYLPEGSGFWGRLPGKDLIIADSPRHPLYACDWCLECTNASQLGGHPSWVQDAEYPACPKCGETMCFVGQISVAEIQPNSEGYYYAFVCSGCRVTCTTYQQT